MSEGDEKYKLGELTSDMAAVKRSQSEMRSDIKEVRADQKEIIHKIDAINAVSVERWEKRNAYVDKTFAAHNVRIESLEDSLKTWQESTFSRILAFLDKTAVQVIGFAVFAVLLAAIIISAQKSAEYGELIREFQSKVQQ